jgi:hypothetical protein
VAASGSGALRDTLKPCAYACGVVLAIGQRPQPWRRGSDGGIQRAGGGSEGAPNDPADAKKPRLDTRDMGPGPTCALMSTLPYTTPSRTADTKHKTSRVIM